MTKIQADTAPEGQAPRTSPPPLSAHTRRHLGINLRSLYAGSLAEPVSERLEALLAKLGKGRS